MPGSGTPQAAWQATPALGGLETQESSWKDQTASPNLGSKKTRAKSPQPNWDRTLLGRNVAGTPDGTSVQDPSIPHHLTPCSSAPKPQTLFIFTL